MHHFIDSIRKRLRQNQLLRQLIAPVAGLPKIKDLDQIYRQYALNNTKEPLSRSLDLGCGSKPRNPFQASQLFGVDIRSLPDLDIHAADLCIKPIPFENDFFDCVTAYDFIEHIPRAIYNPECRFPFVALMNEVLRVLKPGGIFFSQTPLYPFCVSMSDPTHVNFITTETFPNYFCGKTCLGGMYGFHGHFDLLYQSQSDSHLISILRKPSDLIAPRSHSFT